MNLFSAITSLRRKAVWGPKRVISLALVLLAIAPYAAEAPEEYFAVTSELHFSQPALLREAAPEVAR